MTIDSTSTVRVFSRHEREMEGGRERGRERGEGREGWREDGREVEWKVGRRIEGGRKGGRGRLLIPVVIVYVVISDLY